MVQSKLDKFYFYYFLMHVPITILIDSSLAIPPSYRPDFQNAIIDFHISKNKDFLLEQPIDLWLQIFGYFELFFQLPLFFICIFDFLKNKRSRFSYSLWPLILIYGFNAAFTTAVCLVSVYLTGYSNGLDQVSVYNLIGVYLPTFIIPTLMMADYAARIGSRLSGKVDSKEE